MTLYFLKVLGALSFIAGIGYACLVGNPEIEESVPADSELLFGQYLDLLHPARCSGNVTVLHICFHADVRGRTQLSVTVRVWHWRSAQNLELILSMQYQQDLTTNDRGLICMDVQPEVAVPIQAGDVLGVFFPSEIIAIPLPVIAVSSDNASLYKDQRESIDVGAGSSVTLSDLLLISPLALHINAEIEAATTTNLIHTAILSPTSVVVSSPMPSHTQGMNPQNTGAGTSSHLSGGVIAAIVIGLIILILICIICVGILIFLRKRKHQLKPDTKNESTFSLDNITYGTRNAAVDYEVPVSTHGKSHDSYVVMQSVVNNNQVLYSDNGFDDSFNSESSQSSNGEVEQGVATHTVSTTLQDNPSSQNMFDSDIYASSGNPSNSAEYYHCMEETSRDSPNSVCSSPYYVPPTDKDEALQLLTKQSAETIPLSAIMISTQLGKGQFATVKKGLWQKEACGALNVALKTLHSLDANAALQEAAIMAQFRHPNVVWLYGVVSEPFMLVMEYLAQGDLRTVVRAKNKKPVSPDLPELLLSFSQQVALGMHYLSKKGYVHRDLAARNVFVSSDNVCKIGDFGMSRELANVEYYTSHGGTIPIRWTAPEAVYYRKYSSASDIWSYGCLLYEIWSLGRKPFDGLSHTEVLELVDSGCRLAPSSGTPKPIYEIMIQCWSPYPNCRFPFSDILGTLLANKWTIGAKQEPCTLGAEKACEDLYVDLQRTYLHMRTIPERKHVTNGTAANRDSNDYDLVD